MSNQIQEKFSPPPGGTIKPYTGTFGQKQLHHLLRRTLFGVSAADLKAFQGKTLTAVVDALLNVSATPPAPPVKNYSRSATVTQYKQAKDATGNLLFNNDGSPMWIQAKDATGNLLFNPATPIWVQAKDSKGVLLFNNDGSPKWEQAKDVNNKLMTYTNGTTPIWVQAYDAKGILLFNTDGSPVLVQAKDANGTLLFYTISTPVWVQAKDAKGNLLFNNPTPIWVTESITTLDTLDIFTVGNENTNYSKWTGLKMGETWVNYRYNPKDTVNSDGQRRDSLKYWMIKLMLEQDRTIREKMTLFLHNHLATETKDVNDAIMSYNHNALLRKYAVGNFKDLISKVTLDPQMLVYLNGDQNNGANAISVNENYGRELQELFTVGKGLGSGYTEDDVKAAARVLSGWGVTRNRDANATVILDPAVPITSFFSVLRHDKTDKQFSAFYGSKVIKGDSTANGGINEITQLIDMIFSVNEVSKFIVRKLFTFFVYYKIDADIETNVIEPLAELFRTSKFELKPVLKALFTSEYFFKNEYIGSMIKSPLDYVVGHYRTMELTLPTDPKAFEAQYAMANTVFQDALRQGQEIGDPPNVAGWAAYYQAPLFYEVWLDSSSVQNRITFQIKDKLTSGAPFVNAESKNLTAPVQFLKVTLGTSNPNDINVAISDLATLLFPIAISQTTKDKVKTRFFLSTVGNNLKTEAQWTTGINALITNPATTDKNGVAVRENINKLFFLMFFAGEYQLH